MLTVHVGSVQEVGVAVLHVLEVHIISDMVHEMFEIYLAEIYVVLEFAGANNWSVDWKINPNNS